MGRKDASNKAPPVDQYRKQIGKHEYKKDHGGLNKEMKKRSDAKKSAMSIQDVLLLLGTLLTLVVSVYLFFYVFTASSTEKDATKGR